jgi:hypothetical protein
MCAPSKSGKDEQKLTELVLDELAGLAAKKTRKISRIVARAIAEDMLQTFGDGSQLLDAALGPRANARDKFNAVRRAPSSRLAKVIVTTLIRQQLGSEQTRNAILRECGIDKAAIQKEVRTRRNPARRGPAVSILQVGRMD